MARLKCNAGVAVRARLTFLQVRAIEGLCQDASRRRFACSTRTAEQVGMANPVIDEGVLQRGEDVLLPDHPVESAGSESSIERFVGHGFAAYLLGVTPDVRESTTARAGSGTGYEIYSKGLRITGSCLGERPAGRVAAPEILDQVDLLTGHHEDLVALNRCQVQ